MPHSAECRCYACASELQLKLWVEGKSVHTIEGPTGECVPDFSCCKPHLQSDLPVRQAFAAADSKTRKKFLSLFLGALLQDKKVVIADGDPQ